LRPRVGTIATSRHLAWSVLSSNTTFRTVRPRSIFVPGDIVINNDAGQSFAEVNPSTGPIDWQQNGNTFGVTVTDQFGLPVPVTQRAVYDED
jgi:hypothetical protein